MRLTSTNSTVTPHFLPKLTFALLHGRFQKLLFERTFYARTSFKAAYAQFCYKRQKRA